MSRFELSIGAVVARTGIAEPTLRMWERRYGFPEPQRTASGHRRYSLEQAVLIDRVLALRGAGFSLPSAIARAQAPPDPQTISLFSSLRDQRPDLRLETVTKPVLIALSHAIEDEILARADARVVFGCFQREGFFRTAQARWQQLAMATPVAAVFADFLSAEGGADPAEVRIDRRQQLAREWAIVAYGLGSSVAMAAREMASSRVDAASPQRTFELLWTVESETVRTLARHCLGLLRGPLPQLAARAEAELANASAAPSESVALMTAVVGRVLAALS